jgi:hypothetical protein
MTPRSPSPTELRRGEAATWRAEPETSPVRPKMRLVNWKPLEKNSLRGFATVALPLGLKIVDCPVHVSNGKGALDGGTA